MKPQKRMRNAERGMSLIELMMALTLLAVGMAGSLILITTAISSNNRNKVDTTGTLLAQQVMDELAAVRASNSVNVPITDCAGNTVNLSTAGSTAGNGATLTGTNMISYAQNFTDVPAGYSMTYVGCGPAGTRPTYEVRVHVRSLLVIGTTTFTKLIVVSTRRTGVNANTSLRFFSPPVTLRTIAGT